MSSSGNNSDTDSLSEYSQHSSDLEQVAFLSDKWEEAWNRLFDEPVMDPPSPIAPEALNYQIMSRSQLWDLYKLRTTVGRRSLRWPTSSKSVLVTTLKDQDRAHGLGSGWTSKEVQEANRAWHAQDPRDEWWLAGTRFEQLPDDVLNVIWCWKLCSEREADVQWFFYCQRCETRNIRPELMVRWSPMSSNAGARNDIPYNPDYFYITHYTNVLGHTRKSYKVVLHCSQPYLRRAMRRLTRKCCGMWSEQIRLNQRSDVPVASCKFCTQFEYLLNRSWTYSTMFEYGRWLVAYKWGMIAPLQSAYDFRIAAQRAHSLRNLGRTYGDILDWGV